MAVTTTYGKLHIVELANPREKLEIQFVPESIPLQRTAFLSPVNVVNRNNPRQHFTGGETRITLRLNFYADDEAKEAAYNKVNWLLGLTYDDAVRVKLVWGKMFLKHIWRVGSVNSTYSHFWPDQNMMPGYAVVDVTFLLDTYSDLRKNDIRN